jgi:hypothetical protein
VLGRSESVQFSNLVSNTIAFAPGRYAIVPYTDRALSRAMHYALHFNYAAGAVDFEIEVGEMGTWELGNLGTWELGPGTWDLENGNVGPI